MTFDNNMILITFIADLLYLADPPSVVVSITAAVSHNPITTA